MLPKTIRIVGARGGPVVRILRLKLGSFPWVDVSNPPWGGLALFTDGLISSLIWMFRTGVNHS